jgi:hypothetical protein
MQSDTMRNLVEYMRDVRRRNRNNYPARKHSAFDTTVKDHSHRSQRHRSGNAGRSQDS